MNTTIHTIGHSNHSSEAFVILLQQHAIRCLVDVRSQPYSRYNPQLVIGVHPTPDYAQLPSIMISCKQLYRD